MKIVKVGLLVLVTSSAFAHPGGGIIALGPNSVLVGDSVNNAIWHFEAGKKPVRIVDRFHAHWLTRGLDNQLYIEAFQEFGGAWASAAFRLPSLTSKPEVIIDRSDLGALVFLVGKKGELVYPLGLKVVTRKGKGKVSDYAKVLKTDPPLGEVSSMAWGPDGAFYLADANRIRKAGKDEVLRTVARTTGTIIAPQFWAKTDVPRAWGIAVDSQSRIYAAVPDTGEVVRFDSKGKPQVLHKSADGWRASAVALHGGSVFLFETHPIDLSVGPRVKVIRESGKVEMLGVAEPGSAGGSLGSYNR